MPRRRLKRRGYQNALFSDNQNLRAGQLTLTKQPVQT
jgi:hypothetical protein